MTVADDERVLEELLRPLHSVPPARRRRRRPRPDRLLGPAALVAVVALFVVVQPRGATQAVQGRAVQGSAPPSPSLGQLAVRFATSVIGTPYRWGGAAPTGFDTSGLVVWAFAQAGRPGLPHYTGALWRTGPHVGRKALQPGDLVFFAGLTHVGIYIGGGRFVHATPPSVRIARLDAGWAASHYEGAVRISSKVVDAAIIDVRYAIPRQHERLTTTKVNVVFGTDRPRYQVRVANVGETWRAGIRVRFHLGVRGPWQERRVTLGPGAIGTVTFVGPSPRFGAPQLLRIEIVPDRDEQNLGDNSADYTIQYEIH